MTHAYIPGAPTVRPQPLARYLPPIPDGVLTAWLESSFPIDDQHWLHPWILDPFGAAPRLAVEAARAGYRVLVASNNPVSRFLLEIAASPPSTEQFRSALALLAAERRGDERLEPHIRGLYATTCEHCSAEIFAEAFIWERTSSPGDPPEARLTGRIYHCPTCGLSGEHPAAPADIARAAAYAGGGLHRARALERVARRDDPDRRHAEEALDAYPPRAVYALFTIINRLDGMNLTGGQRIALTALLLHACDQANTLWPHPAGRARPRQLTIPPRYRENNIWMALEAAIELWSSEGSPVPLAVWPELPPAGGGICLYEGRLKDLADWLQTVPVQAVAAALPRPNQAFWTLSALWAGWLWGQEAVAPFKSVLRRRRYDWSWHATALHAALESLAPQVKPGTPFLGLVGEAEPGFLSAAITAADLAGFALDGLALRSDSGGAQIIWHTREAEPHPTETTQPVETARLAALALLDERGQPATYLQLHTAAVSSLATVGFFRHNTASPAEAITRLNTTIEEAFTYRHGFIRFGGSEKSLEVGLWWQRPDRGDSPARQPPLSDRVEMTLVNYLLKNPGADIHAIDRAICTAFPGLLTPSTELVMVCLESYAGEDPPGSGNWRIYPQDQPRTRRTDMDEVNDLLAEIGRRLGFIPEGNRPLVWKDNAGMIQRTFHTIASGVVGELLLGENPAGSGVIVIPGGRANLVAFKFQRDPRLRQAIENGWKVARYRLVRALAANPALTVESFDAQVSADNLTYESPQLRLF